MEKKDNFESKRPVCKMDTIAEKGFTLIELVVVIVVISILAVVTIPRYQRFVEHFKLEASSQTAIATLRYARQLAIKERSANNIYVGFMNDGMQILFGQGTSGLDLMGPKVQFESGVRFVKLEPLPSLSLTDTHNATYTGGVSYQWEGFLGTNLGLTTNDLIVTLEGSLGDSVVIEISATTGDIKVSWS